MSEDILYTIHTMIIIIMIIITTMIIIMHFQALAAYVGHFIVRVIWIDLKC